MLFVVAERIKWEDLQMPMAETDFRGEQLRRRCAASGWLSAGGFAFSFLYPQFDQSLDSPFIFGIYALAVGVVGCVTYKTRHYLHRAAQRRKIRKATTDRKATTELIFLGGGIS
jgi:hypothetical protein